jgi:hypothetical protein
LNLRWFVHKLVRYIVRRVPAIVYRAKPYLEWTIPALRGTLLARRQKLAGSAGGVLPYAL